MNESSLPERGHTGLKLRPEATQRAIEEPKRRGKETWGAIYYSQLAPLELCNLAGRAHQVQYGALISWLERLDEAARAVRRGAIELVAHLVNVAPDDSALTTHVARSEPSARRSALERLTQHESKLAVNCLSVVHDYRFVVVGELPRPDLSRLIRFTAMKTAISFIVSHSFVLPALPVHFCVTQGRRMRPFI